MNSPIRRAAINRAVIAILGLILAACNLPAARPVPLTATAAGTLVIPPTLLTPPPTLTPFLPDPTETVENTVIPSATATTLVLPADTQTPVPTATLPPPTDTPVPTATLPPPPTDTPRPDLPVQFAVIGDYGQAGKPAADVAALVDSWNPHFIITVGDNNYPTGSSDTIDENIGQYYQEYIDPYQGAYGDGADFNRFFPTLGNHEYMTYNAEPYFNYFELPGNERYYDFTWGPVHLFALNSNEFEPDGVGESSVQASWLRDQLASSSLPWKVVYFHYAPYSSGIHGGTDWMRWPFEEWGASAVLAGHDHNYERIMRMDFPYFINGLGGGPRYDISREEGGSVVQFDADYGAMLVTADWETITYQFITRSGLVVDTFQQRAGELAPGEDG